MSRWCNEYRTCMYMCVLVCVNCLFSLNIKNVNKMHLTRTCTSCVLPNVWFQNVQVWEVQAVNVLMIKIYFIQNQHQKYTTSFLSDASIICYSTLNKVYCKWFPKLRFREIQDKYE